MTEKRTECASTCVLFKRVSETIPNFLNVMRQSACLVFDPTMLITMLPSLITRRLTPSLIARTSGVRLYDDPDLKLFILFDWNQSLLTVAWHVWVQLVFYFCSRLSVMLFCFSGISSCRAAYCICVF